MTLKMKVITSLLLGLLLAIGVLMLPTGAAADDGLTEAEVRAAVQTWVRYVTADARPDAVVERMEPHQVDGETVAYIAHLEGGGFCICGADVLVLPVYFYSPEGVYDPENPSYAYFLWEIRTRLEGLREQMREDRPDAVRPQAALRADLADREAYWRELIAGRVPKRAEAERVRAMAAEGEPPDKMELRFNAHWHQGSGNPVSRGFNTFNADCPILTPNIDPTAPLPNERALVGCVATAMAQTMYYWEWPNTPEGGDESVDYEYRWRSGWATQTLASDPGIPTPAKYPWIDRLEYDAVNNELRMNGYWDGSLYEAAQAISRTYAAYQTALGNLWADSGFTTVTQQYNAPFSSAPVSYRWNLMQDRQAGSGTVSNTEMAELSYHAGVAATMSYGIQGSSSHEARTGDALEDHFRYYTDTIHHDGAQTETMATEIQWLRPLIFGGSSPTGGGHCWVVYGYDKTNDPNRQFKMNLGWGGSCDGWYTTDVMTTCLNATFVVTQGHTTQIAPLDVVRFVGNNEPGDGSPDSPYENIEEALDEAQDWATLIFKAGSINTFSSDPLVIDRPVILRGKDATIRRED